jgi:hypothetical protein
MKKNGTSEDFKLDMKRKTGSIVCACRPSATQLLAKERWKDWCRGLG